MSSCAAVTEIVQTVPVSVPCQISAVLLLLHVDSVVIKASLGASGWLEVGHWHRLLRSRRIENCVFLCVMYIFIFAAILVIIFFNYCLSLSAEMTLSIHFSLNDLTMGRAHLQNCFVPRC